MSNSNGKNLQAEFNLVKKTDSVTVDNDSSQVNVNIFEQLKNIGVTPEYLSNPDFLAKFQTEISKLQSQPIQVEPQAEQIEIQVEKTWSDQFLAIKPEALIEMIKGLNAYKSNKKAFDAIFNNEDSLTYLVDDISLYLDNHDIESDSLESILDQLYFKSDSFSELKEYLATLEVEAEEKALSLPDQFNNLSDAEIVDLIKGLNIYKIMQESLDPIFNSEKGLNALIKSIRDYLRKTSLEANKSLAYNLEVGYFIHGFPKFSAYHKLNDKKQESEFLGKYPNFPPIYIELGEKLVKLASRKEIVKLLESTPLVAGVNKPLSLEALNAILEGFNHQYSGSFPTADRLRTVISEVLIPDQPIEETKKELLYKSLGAIKSIDSKFAGHSRVVDYRIFPDKESFLKAYADRVKNNPNPTISENQDPKDLLEFGKYSISDVEYILPIIKAKNTFKYSFNGGLDYIACSGDSISLGKFVFKFGEAVNSHEVWLIVKPSVVKHNDKPVKTESSPKQKTEDKEDKTVTTTKVEKSKKSEKLDSDKDKLITISESQLETFVQKAVKEALKGDILKQEIKRLVLVDPAFRKELGNLLNVERLKIGQDLWKFKLFINASDLVSEDLGLSELMEACLSLLALYAVLFPFKVKEPTTTPTATPEQPTATPKATPKQSTTTPIATPKATPKQSTTTPKEQPKQPKKATIKPDKKAKLIEENIGKLAVGEEIFKLTRDGRSIPEIIHLVEKPDFIKMADENTSQWRCYKYIWLLSSQSSFIKDALYSGECKFYWVMEHIKKGLAGKWIDERYPDKGFNNEAIAYFEGIIKEKINK